MWAMRVGRVWTVDRGIRGGNKIPGGIYITDAFGVVDGVPSAACGRLGAISGALEALIFLRSQRKTLCVSFGFGVCGYCCIPRGAGLLF
jgi:hypothetical protein